MIRARVGLTAHAIDIAFVCAEHGELFALTLDRTAPEVGMANNVIMLASGRGLPREGYADDYPMPDFLATHCPHCVVVLQPPPED